MIRHSCSIGVTACKLVTTVLVTCQVDIHFHMQVGVMPYVKHSSSSERQGRGHVAQMLTCMNNLSAPLTSPQEGYHGMMLLMLLPTSPALHTVSAKNMSCNT